ncbi:PDZ domain-containing protein [Desulfobacterales bacterium HSG17]|nr:PDZ domain-containing protein [Desulfobacterales bacterium HSG17]
MKVKFLCRIIFAVFIFLIYQPILFAATDSLSIIKVDKDKLTFQVQKEPLGNIVNEIINECDVEIVGLEARGNDLITFSAEQEPVENVIKRLLKYLNENNFAFEYSKTSLRRVSVLPKAKGKDIVRRPPIPAQTPKPVKEDKERAVKILKVNEGTQAESLDLQKDDLIIEYDGNRIKSARQLVKAVKKKAPEESVEMIVVREGQSIRIALNGGLIGVNVLTVSVPKSELGQ